MQNPKIEPLEGEGDVIIGTCASLLKAPVSNGVVVTLLSSVAESKEMAFPEMELTEPVNTGDLSATAVIIL